VLDKRSIGKVSRISIRLKETKILSKQNYLDRAKTQLNKENFFALPQRSIHARILLFLFKKVKGFEEG